jgi:hypothetical protein
MHLVAIHNVHIHLMGVPIYDITSMEMDKSTRFLRASLVAQATTPYFEGDI